MGGIFLFLLLFEMVQYLPSDSVVDELIGLVWAVVNCNKWKSEFRIRSNKNQRDQKSEFSLQFQQPHPYPVPNERRIRK